MEPVFSKIEPVFINALFITSRHSETLSHVFRVIDDAVHQPLLLCDVSPALGGDDISIFLAHEMEDIRKHLKDFNLSPGWPGKPKICCEEQFQCPGGRHGECPGERRNS
jgi:hypothetical protein